ncbi:MAG: VWA domain-containing protein [Candidatus Thermoplasmatota archaeon]|nr:VWA domain-containing protein [Candidatus Thermoplasmatota archaeon]
MSRDMDIPYPHIRGDRVVLPDCEKGVYAPFKLTASEKRELVKILAQKGLHGIDEYLARPLTDGSIARRMEDIRKQTVEQLKQLHTTRKDVTDSEIKRLMWRGAVLRGEQDDGSIDDESAFRRFSSAQIRGELLSSDLIGLIEGREVAEEEGVRPGAFRRMFWAVKRFFVRIISVFLRLIRRIIDVFRRKRGSDEKGRRYASGKKKGAIALPFPGLSADLDRWKKAMDGRIDGDEHLQKAVSRRLSERYGYDAGLIELRRSFDPEWYREKARSVLEEEVEENATRKKDELDKSRSEALRTRAERKEEERRIREELMRAEKRLEMEGYEVQKKAQLMTRERMKKELLRTLANMGYVQGAGRPDGLEEASLQWEITEALVEKFSEFIFAELTQRSSVLRDRRGKQISDAGVYEKARMRTVSEEPRMDFLGTMVNARVNHPRDRSIDPFDIIVHREITTSELHCVILVDVSGSMEENQRLEAAKRSVLALSQAVKRDNPRNKVDIISVSTRAKPVTLKEVIALEPHGFTNHQEGFALARAILECSRSDRFMLFLITDGLPEAYIDISGKPVAGDLQTSMDMALAEVNALKRIPDLYFEMFLLEPEDERYISAARRIARAAEGNVIVADPQELAYKVIGEFMATGRPLEGV